jgi:hypothetical protein
MARSSGLIPPSLPVLSAILASPTGRTGRTPAEPPWQERPPLGSSLVALHDFTDRQHFDPHLAGEVTHSE